MVFYVYVDPSVIDAARDGGPYAMQVLIAALRGFVQNCFIVEFEDGRIRDGIGEKVDALPATFDRKVLSALLVVLAKRNRFLYCLVPDYGSGDSDTTRLLDQAGQLMIDLALISAPLSEDAVVPSSLQVTVLQDYQHTHFEDERYKLACNGRTTLDGQVGAQQFLDWHFRKALRYATKIEICDKLFGSKFGDNYKHTAEELIKWLGANLSDVARCTLVFHCAQPAGQTGNYIKTVLATARNSHAPGLAVEVLFYQLPSGDNAMPHERFVITDQIALGIDRGMDFLDRNSGQARDVFVNYKSSSDCEGILRHYAAGRQAVMTI